MKDSFVPSAGPWPADHWNTPLVRNLTSFRAERSASRRRNTGIVLLGRLGKRAATDEALTALERCFRRAEGDERLLIAQVLGGISEGGADRLRDLLMELLLADPADPEGNRWQTAGAGLVGCVSGAAWRRLDEAFALDWVRRAASLLAQAEIDPFEPAQLPGFSSGAAIGHRVGPAVVTEGKTPLLESRLGVVLAVLGHCMERIPSPIRELAGVFDAACEAEISRRVIRLLAHGQQTDDTIRRLTRQQSDPYRLNPLMDSRPPLLAQAEEQERERVVSRLLELADDDDDRIRRLARQQLAESPLLAREPRVAEWLKEAPELGSEGNEDPAPALASQPPALHRIAARQAGKSAGNFACADMPPAAEQENSTYSPTMRGVGPSTGASDRERLIELAQLPPFPHMTHDPEKIREALRSPQQWSFAFRSLGMLGSAAVSRMPELLPELCAIAFGTDRAEVVSGTGEQLSPESWIGEIVAGSPQAAQTAQALEAALLAFGSPQWQMRERAVGVFGCVGIEEANGWIARLAGTLNEGQPNARAAAMRALAGFGRAGHDAAATQQLVGLLRDPSAAVRRAAVELARARSKLWLGDSMWITQENDPGVEPEVIAGLCLLVDDAKLSYEGRLFDASAEGQKQAPTLVAAVETLGTMWRDAYPAAANTLLNRVLDDDAEIQLLAAQALFNMGPEAHGRALDAVLAMIQ